MTDEEKTHCAEAARAFMEKVRGYTYASEHAVGPVNWWVLADLLAKERADAVARAERAETLAKEAEAERDRWHAELADQTGINEQEVARYSRLVSERDALRAKLAASEAAAAQMLASLVADDLLLRHRGCFCDGSPDEAVGYICDGCRAKEARAAALSATAGTGWTSPEGVAAARAEARRDALAEAEAAIDKWAEDLEWPASTSAYGASERVRALAEKEG